jgi:thiol-disulfide isomerase/thioredoxin
MKGLESGHLISLNREKRNERMKRGYYIAAVSFLVIVLTVIAIYIHEKRDNPSPTQRNGKTDRTEQFFREMGFNRMAPAAGPFDVGLQDLDGRTVNLSKFRGKIVFLNFWTTWCQSCRDEVPSMGKLYDELKNRDFAMVAVNLQEQVSAVEKFVQAQAAELSFTVLLDLDGKARNLFGVGTIPSTFILDKEGRIIGSAIGAREWDNKKSLALFQHLIDEETAPSP